MRNKPKDFRMFQCYVGQKTGTKESISSKKKSKQKKSNSIYYEGEKTKLPKKLLQGKTCESDMVHGYLLNIFSLHSRPNHWTLK